MPYKIKGKCIYKKDTGKKVGCTKGSVKKYMKALHANVNESLNECYELKNAIVSDDKSEATVLFRLTKSPGSEIGLVFSMPDADYQYGIIKDGSTRQLHRFEDPAAAKKMLRGYGLTPNDVENEMYQQAYEAISSAPATEDDGVKVESLAFEALFAKIINS